MDYLLNSKKDKFCFLILYVLNLIINGLPSKPKGTLNECLVALRVLNLIINGLPSKQKTKRVQQLRLWCFKPYYKWITF